MGRKETIGLTVKQEHALVCLMGYIAEHGYAPTVQELADDMGLASRTTAHVHLRKLEAKGYIRWDGHSPRAIAVLRGPKRRGGGDA